MSTNDPETLRLARLALERKKAEDEMLAQMCEPCRRVYVGAWAKRIAAQWAELGEIEYDGSK